MLRIAVFPGSFSPFTIGHQAIIKKALPLFDKIIIAIGKNSQKNEYFNIDKRLKWIKSVYKKNKKIHVKSYNGITVEFCKKEKAKYILRGLRNCNDFEYEKTIAHMNNNLNDKIESIFILTPPHLSHISSSIVREIIKNGGDVKKFLPPEIDL